MINAISSEIYYLFIFENMVQIAKFHTFIHCLSDLISDKEFILNIIYFLIVSRLNYSLTTDGGRTI